MRSKSYRLENLMAREEDDILLDRRIGGWQFVGNHDFCIGEAVRDLVGDEEERAIQEENIVENCVTCFWEGYGERGVLS